jgi:hypothetical protein
VLSGFGIEVWYDENELDGGDAWDQKIRRQIRECDYFMPMISATTEARSEGYFRREWRLAVERTLDMADDRTFLLPVVIDATSEAGARVPEKFVAVQWLKAPGGLATPALQALCRRIISGRKDAPLASSPPTPTTRAQERANRRASQAGPIVFPEFPQEEPGQRLRFWFQTLGWAFRCGWTLFMRLPRVVRLIVYMWLFFVVLVRGCDSPHRHSADLSASDAKKLKAIADAYHGSSSPADIATLGKEVASQFSSEQAKNVGKESADDDDENNDNAPLLAIPFAASAAEPAAAKLANVSFAQVYGRIAINHQGKVALSHQPLTGGLDLGTALARGRASHSTHVLCGAIETHAPLQVLTVEVVAVADGSVVWSKSYPVVGTDPETIAADVEAKVATFEN